MAFRIIVVSDSHGNYTALRRLVEKELPFDMLVHCGDGVGDLFHAGIPAGVTVLRVPGNVDLGRVTDMERVIFHEIRERRVMVTHGDLFRLHQGYDDLLREAGRNGAQVVFFGHTHRKYISTDEPVLFNPGPLSSGVYGVVTVDDQWHFEHGYMGEDF